MEHGNTNTIQNQNSSSSTGIGLLSFSAQQLDKLSSETCELLTYLQLVKNNWTSDWSIHLHHRRSPRPRQRQSEFGTQYKQIQQNLPASLF